MQSNNMRGFPPARQNNAPENGQFRDVNPQLNVLDLFSGVGAYSLGLERTGAFRTTAFCEIKPYNISILKRHWPHVPVYEDVENLTGESLRAAGLVPDWIVGGWPCQDISVAGTGRGLDGARSGLFEHIARLAGELRPTGLLLENSTNLLAINGGRDFGYVLSRLAALGYDACWHCLPAAAFDAPHIRDRLWIVAVVADASCDRREGCAKGGILGTPHAPSARCSPERTRRADGACGAENAANATSDGRREGGARGAATHSEGRIISTRAAPSYAYRLSEIGPAIARRERHNWEPEPNVGRVASGVASRMDRLYAIGNLNPPIIPETIGRAILSSRVSV